MSVIKILFFIGTLLLCACATTSNVQHALKNIPQNTAIYLDPNTENNILISTPDQKLLTQYYWNRYFSPWTNQHRVLTNSDIKQAEDDYIQMFMDEPGWGSNKLPLKQIWISTLVHNMDMPSFPNHLVKAITINTTNLRVLPTQQPSFGNWHQAGEGYPFDNLQESSLAANIPVLIVQTSRDGAWSLVLTNNDLGWLPTQDVAAVNNNIISAWQKTTNYLAITQNSLPIFSTQQQFIFTSGIGAVFPFIKQNKNSFTIVVAVANSNHQATIQQALVNKSAATSIPLAITAKNIAALANNMQTTPYGWGGLYGNRDCSLTMQNLFAPFGIWLPRNSHDQARMGKVIDLKGLSATQKQIIIKKQGIPFLSLIGMPGHIVLYIGQYHDEAYVFQDVWGLHTRNLWGTEGRAIIGKTVITPLSIGQSYINVPLSLLDKATSLTLLNSHPAIISQQF